MLQYPDLLHALVTTEDGAGHRAFSAKPDLTGGRKTVTVTAPNQDRFVFTQERGGRVVSKTLSPAQHNDEGHFNPPKGGTMGLVQTLVDWCGERTPPAFQSSLRANLAWAQDNEKQRQAGINAALAEEPLARHSSASRVGFGGTDGAGQPALGSA